MKTILRYLSPGMQGDDALHLKIQLFLLGHTKLFAVRPPVASHRPVSPRRSRVDEFDAATADAVKKVQAKFKLPVTGVVDEATAARIGAALEEGDRYAVYGFVRVGDGDALDGVAVSAFDRDMRREEPLGRATTAAGGFFLIRYERSKFTRAEKARADLLLRVTDARGAGELARSGIHFDADRVYRCDPKVARASVRGPSEYERHLKEVQPLVEKVPLHQLTGEDIQFLSAETGIPAQHLRFLHLDAAFRRGSQLEPSVFYGLLRQGMPADRRRLLAEPAARLREALKASLRHNLVPGALEGKLEAILAALHRAGIESALEPDGEDGAPGLGEALRTASIPKDAGVRFVDFVLRYDGDEAGFWENARSSAKLDDETVDALRFTLTARALVFDHLKTLDALQAISRERGWKAPSAIARVKRDEWRALTARTGHPPEFAGHEAFADAIADEVERVYPTAVAAARLADDPDLGSDDLRVFFEANPDFDLLHTRVDDYLSHGADVGRIKDRKATREALVTLQRVMRIAPERGRSGIATALIGKGFTSAASIVQAGERDFMATMTPVIGDAEATVVFRHARMRSDATQMLHQQFRDYLGERFRVLPGLDLGTDVDIPSWARLFGSPNACACEHCRSVYGPGAYLVDLLQFLKRAPGDARPLDALLARRPDLQHIELGCANAVTALPYIDLVNEILEAAVAGATRVDWRAYQTPEANGETRADIERRLRATPQHELAAAYEPLATAAYPWGLPFSPDQERAWLFCRHLGVDLAELWRLFGRNEDQAARGALGFGEAEWHLLTRPLTEVATERIWGTGDLGLLETVPEFLRRAGLSYEDLRRLTGTWFLSEGGLADIGLVLRDGPDADPCDIADYRLHGLRTGSGERDRHVLDQIHRFLRVQRRLGWSIADLDAVLAALGTGRIDGDTLREVERVKRLADAYRRPPGRIVEAAGPALADLLGLREADASLLATLTGVGDIAALDLRQRLRLLEQGAALRGSDVDLREATYILLGRDQTPPAFTPADEDLRELLRRLHRFVRDQRRSAPLSDDQVAELIVENVATHLQLDPALCARLIRPVVDPETGAEAAAALVGSERDPAAPAIADLAAFVAISAGDRAPDEVEPSTSDSARRLLVRLDRVARLLRRLGVDRRELDVIAATRADNGFLDLGRLETPSDGAGPSASDLFDGWLALARAKRLQGQLPRADWDLFDFLARAADASRSDAELFASLNAHTGWSVDPATGERFREAAGGAEIDVPLELSRLMGLDRAALRRIDTYARLHRAVQALRRWRIRPDTLALWSDPSRPVADLAASLERAARARHADDASWYEVLAPMTDLLRERKRDALMAYLLHREGLGEPADLYARYLIDPEMSSCMSTSRIKAASASVQLFVQRVLLNLEDDLRPQAAVAESWHDHWRQWAWMKSYRVWEANRKVFLYPENWIQPELRDDKSPFFKELENALLQDEVNDTTVERAYRRYLSSVTQVTRLDVRAIYVEKGSGRRGHVARDVLHLFARTQSEPHVYFHRRRDLGTGIWTAWEQIDLNIEGDHLIPVVHEGRLMVFWPVFRDVDEGESWEVSLACSVYEDRRWQAAKVGSARLRLPAQPRTDFTFRLDTTDGVLRVLVFRQYYGRAGGRAPLPESYSLCERAFVFNVCDQTSYLESLRPIRVLLHPDRVDAHGMLFAEDGSDGDQLFLIDGTVSDDTIDIDPEVFDALVELIHEGGLGGILVGIVLGAAVVLSELREMQERIGPRALLDSTPGRFRLVPAHQDRQLTDSYPLVFQDDSRSFLVIPQVVPLILWGGRITTYRFELLYHPYSCVIVERFNRDGLDGLLSPPSFVLNDAGRPVERNVLDRQFVPEKPSPLLEYRPTASVTTPLPTESVSFDLTDAYARYNWEVFFHIPLLVATRLGQNARFEEAQRWFHYIFDPTDTSPHPAPAKYWRVKPFFDLAKEPPETLADLLRRVAAGDGASAAQVAAWREDPFNPHAIARLRHIAFMKAVTMAYLDNLIAWGDHLFRQDTMESINEATQLYVLASEILGPRPITLSHDQPRAFTFAELQAGGGHLDELSNAWLELESLVPADPGAADPASDSGTPRLLPYFCIPPNDKLLAYWDTVADRLFKIRHCMNIEGQERRLPLFEPPIDPALLVRARAAGVDLRTVLGRRAAGTGHYRYAVTYQRAMDFCNDVRALGQALLAALEKRDAEEIALLRSRHELSLLSEVGRIKDLQIDEARASLESARHARRLAEKRLDYYASQDYRNAAERAQIDHLHVAHGFEVAAQSIKSIAPILYSFPNITVGLGAGTTFGGTHLGSAINAAADAIGIFASQYTFEATMSSLTGSHDRRRDDWNLQADLAEKELAQIDKQIAAAEIRLAIAEQDRDTHRRQMEQVREVDEFLRGKFTNRDLHGWMEARLSALHYQAYQMSLELALQAEASAERELGLRPGELGVIGFEHWNGAKKGLLAGELLQQELRRLDGVFLERNRRKLEITKHVSLATLDPRALVELRATGSCTIRLPEWLFDLDYPGHDNRRIKSVSLTIPCVTGPYTSVSCTLTQTESWIRYGPASDPEPGPLAVQSIATSTAQNDGGVFELAFRDERYLPFEGSGVISTWRLELSGKWQVDVDDDGEVEDVDLSQFDFETISDVVLHVSYEARAASDGGVLKKAAITRLHALFGSLRETPLVRLVSARHEFPNEWHGFLRPVVADGTQSFTLPLAQDRFPFLFQGRRIAIHKIEVLVKIEPESSSAYDESTLRVSLAAGEAAPGPADAATDDLVPLVPWNGLLRGERTVAGGPGQWTLSMWRNTGERLDADAIEDVVLLYHFTTD